MEPRLNLVTLGVADLEVAHVPQFWIGQKGDGEGGG